MFNSILVVCVGNICRSPTGERLLKKVLPEKNITSAGLSALIGKPADATSYEVAKENGILLEMHMAKQITADLCRENDLILVMEKRHVEAVCNIAEEARGKIMLFGHWAEQEEISDPYRKSRELFELVFLQLESSAKKWAEVLNH